MPYIFILDMINFQYLYQCLCFIMRLKSIVLWKQRKVAQWKRLVSLPSSLRLNSLCCIFGFFWYRNSCWTHRSNKLFKSPKLIQNNKFAH